MERDRTTMRLLACCLGNSRVPPIVTMVEHLGQVVSREENNGRRLFLCLLMSSQACQGTALLKLAPAGLRPFSNFGNLSKVTGPELVEAAFGLSWERYLLEAIPLLTSDAAERMVRWLTDRQEGKEKMGFGNNRDSMVRAGVAAAAIHAARAAEVGSPEERRLLEDAGKLVALLCDALAPSSREKEVSVGTVLAVRLAVLESCLSEGINLGVFEDREVSLEAVRKAFAYKATPGIKDNSSRSIPGLILHRMAGDCVKDLLTLTLNSWMGMLEEETAPLIAAQEYSVRFWQQHAQGDTPSPSKVQWLVAHQSLELLNLLGSIRESELRFAGGSGSSADTMACVADLCEKLRPFAARYDRRLELNLEEGSLENILELHVTTKEKWQLDAILEHLVEFRLRECLSNPAAAAVLTERSPELVPHLRQLYETALDVASPAGNALLFAVIRRAGEDESRTLLASHCEGRVADARLKTPDFDADLRNFLNKVVGGGERSDSCDQDSSERADARWFLGLMMMDSAAVLRKVFAEGCASRLRVGLMGSLISWSGPAMGLLRSSSSPACCRWEMSNVVMERFRDEPEVLEDAAAAGCLEKLVLAAMEARPDLDLAGEISRLMASHLLDFGHLVSDWKLALMCTVLDRDLSDGISKDFRFKSLACCELMSRVRDPLNQEKLLDLLKMFCHFKYDGIEKLVGVEVPELAAWSRARRSAPTTVLEAVLLGECPVGKGPSFKDRSRLVLELVLLSWRLLPGQWGVLADLDLGKHFRRPLQKCLVLMDVADLLLTTADSREESSASVGAAVKGIATSVVRLLESFLEKGEGATTNPDFGRLLRLATRAAASTSDAGNLETLSCLLLPLFLGAADSAPCGREQLLGQFLSVMHLLSERLVSVKEICLAKIVTGQGRPNVM